MMNSDRKEFLNLRTLPARLDAEQAAWYLGFLPHEITVLMSAGLLKPLGKPAANGHKFFYTMELVTLAENRDWLDKATRVVSKRWQDRNRKADSISKNMHQ